jgi:hypothetical protein
MMEAPRFATLWSNFFSADPLELLVTLHIDGCLSDALLWKTRALVHQTPVPGSTLFLIVDSRIHGLASGTDFRCRDDES